MASAPSVPAFSISDFLVPGIQPKGWEDWQVSDELNPFATGDIQDFSNFNTPFDLAQSGLWDASGLPMDQAYDELVFDLAPSNFQTPATVNIADLIVGPDALTPTSISPLDLSFTMNQSNYQDLALANLYGFTEPEDVVQDDFSDSGSDLSEADSDLSSDDDDDEEMEEVPEKAKDIQMEMAKEPLVIENLVQEAPKAKPATIEDVNKRRMEEALVARISNDLGDEHMPGLFRILKGSDDAEDDDDEMEVDLSCLDESTLVQVYQYVETCCMQTVGSILAAEEERKRQEHAREQARIEQQAREQAEEAAYQERQRLYAARTPELSPSYSSGSSSSPSPPHPSSTPPPVRSRTKSNNKRRSATASSACTVYREHSDVEQDTLWMGTQVKSKRKRGDNNSAVCMGGGGTGKGRRIQKLNTFVTSQPMFQAVNGSEDEEMEEYGEDDEIDVVGI
ncbi:hypothetical protein BG005_006928 [Podila minutissima]|nr:hypothetical protein BG005_006928 [Podila minutissima]